MAPPAKSNAARKSAYDSTTHCKSRTVASKLFCSAGNATLTTVPSIKTMLDPRMVAAKTQGSDTGAHGKPAGRARTTPSSHGWMKIFAMFLSGASNRTDSGPLRLARGAVATEVASGADSFPALPPRREVFDQIGRGASPRSGRSTARVQGAGLEPRNRRETWKSRSRAALDADRS